VGQGAILGFTPLLARQYSPNEIGIAGVFIAIASIVGTLATFRFELLIPTANDSEIPWLLWTAMWCLSVSAVLAGLVYLIVVPTSGWNALFLSLTIFSLGGVALALQSAMRQQKLAGVAGSKAAQGVVQVVGQVLAGAVGATKLGMQFGYAIGYLSSAGVQTIALVRGSRKRARAVEPVKRSRKIALWKQASMLAVAASLNVLTVWMYPVFTAWFFGPEETGQLTIAQRFAIAPAGMIVASLTPVLVAAIGLRIRSHLEVTSTVLTWLRRLTPLGLIVFLVMIAVPEPFILAVLGSEWIEVDSYLRAMALMVSGQLIIGPLSQVLVLQGRARTQLAWDGCRLVTLLAATAATAAFTENAVAMIFAASIVMFAFYGIYATLILRNPRVLPSG
jgi:O-antigen/teichoic acid export membrane protein